MEPKHAISLMCDKVLLVSTFFLPTSKNKSSYIAARDFMCKKTCYTLLLLQYDYRV